ncbi:MAG: S8 family serine peptidase [Thermoleophilia bacterium]
MTINTLRKIILAGFVLMALVAVGGLAVWRVTGGDGGPVASSAADIIAARIATVGEGAAQDTGPAADSTAAGTVNTTHLTQQRSGALPQQSKEGPPLDSSLSQLAQVALTQGADASAGFADSHAMHFKDGRVQVIVESAADEPTATIAAVTDNGGVVETTYRNLVQATVPPENLAALASSAQVTRVREPQRPVTSAVTSEGVADIAANTWQSAGYKGAGVRVAVIDPGFSGYTDRIASGDLPAGVITQSFVAGGNITTGGIHGTACAEIVYDTAPDAQLYLVNYGTIVELGNALDYIQSQGIQVVSSSWSYPGTTAGDGSGWLDDRVAQLNAAGVLWVNAAGNAAQMHWSGPFVDANHNNWMEFKNGDEINNFYAYAGETIYVSLTWNKWPVTNQDYDLLLYQAGGVTPVAGSALPQTGSQEPVESFTYTIPADGYYDVMVNNYHGLAAGDANMDLFVFSKSPPHYQVAAGSLTGPPTDSSVGLTAGAVQVNTNTLEYFSSRGPTADGRIKPDLVGPDWVTTATYGVSGFRGTSAAAPHAAGAAALIRGAHPVYSPASTKNVLMSRATDPGVTVPDNLFGSGKLNLGILPVPGSLDYFFSWYDQASAGMRDWVIMGNTSAIDTATADVQVGADIQGEYTLTPGQVKTPQYAGVIGGPTQIISQGSKPMIVSQRILMGNSFEEVLGTDSGKLSNHYYWTWYDQHSPGMTDWVLLANPSDTPVTYQINIAGTLMPPSTANPGTIPAHGKVTPTFAGVIGGPVEVTSVGGNVIASQRVLSNFGTAFNEVPGIPAGDLSNHYYWTWYDQHSPGMTDWVLLANPTNAEVTYQINIAGTLMPRSTANPGTIPAHGKVTPTFAGVIGGPVEVTSVGGNVIASQRVIAGPSFEEVPGYRATDLATGYRWTWYDQQSAGVTDWVLVDNPGGTQVNYVIKIGGATMPVSVANPGTIPAHGRVTPTFPGKMAGPVEVTADGNIMVSQRVLWNGFFNEVLGKTSP